MNDAQLAGDVGDGAVAITPLGGCLGHEPDGPLPELGWIPPLEWAGVALLCHDSIFLQAMGSPPKSGRFTSTCLRSIHANRSG